MARREMKGKFDKRFLIVLGLVFLLSLNFVAAQQGGPSPLSDLSGLLEKGFEFIQPVLEALFGAPMNIDTSAPVSSDYIARIMFFLIVFSIVYLAVLKIPFFNQNDAIRWIVTIGVTVLATRWLASDAGGSLVQTLLLPYDALGLSLAAFLPLIIYFFFIEIGIDNITLRKSAWIFFFVVFVFLWISRADELVTAASNYAGMVYPISAVLCLVFFWFDGTIQKWLAKVSGNKLTRTHNKSVQLTIRKKMKDIKDLYDSEGDAYESHFFPSTVKGYEAYRKDMDKLGNDLASARSS